MVCGKGGEQHQTCMFANHSSLLRVVGKLLQLPLKNLPVVGLFGDDCIYTWLLRPLLPLSSLLWPSQCLWLGQV